MEANSETGWSGRGLAPWQTTGRAGGCRALRRPNRPDHPHLLAGNFGTLQAALGSTNLFGAATLPRPGMSKKTLKPSQQITPIEAIERRIFLIRGQKVMVDRDLAELYGVKAIALRQQVKGTSTGFLKILCSSSRKKR